MKRLARALVEFVRFGMRFVEEGFFLVEELGEAGAVEAWGHDAIHLC